MAFSVYPFGDGPFGLDKFGGVLLPADVDVELPAPVLERTLTAAVQSRTLEA